ncbi:MAG: acyl--CoA ligase [Kordiimonadaceae bacterium]|nr:acyl--CoA ligase [Kordiimonadaceae bacterium]
METSLLHRLQFLATSERANHLALVCDGTEYSYSQLWKKIQCLAAEMLQNGLVKGQRVVICCGNSQETVCGFWATLLAGGCACIISDEQPVSKIKYVIEDSGATILITHASIVEKLGDVYLSNNVNLVEVLITKTGLKEGKSPGTKKLQLIAALSPENHQINTPIISQDLAAIIYTSGSTGEPNGVMLSHRNMICARDSLNEYLGNKAEDVFANALPLSFDYGLYQMIMAHSIGATLVLEKNLIWPLELMKNIAHYKATVPPAVPVLVDLFEQFSSINKYSLESIRYVSNTGAALNGKHFSTMQRLFPQAKIFSMFGLTECKRCTYLPPQDLERKTGSVGLAIPNTEICVVDDEDKLCGPNEVGQLVVRGETVMQGYWNKPEATAKKIRPHPIHGDRCLYSGDYGYLDEEGYFYFKGRMDHALKVRGRKLIPKEIEDVIQTFDGVREVAILGLEQENSPTKIICFITLDKTKFHLNDVIGQTKKSLESFQVPTDFIVLPSMPRNLNGKIDLPALKADYLAKSQKSEALEAS